MDSLFDNLLNKTAGGNRTEVEDFFTEVFAHLMRNPEVLTGFLKASDLSNIVPTDRARIMTQCQFGSSRPDITIQLFDGDRSDLLFIENKIDSLEGFHQLKKYAKELSRHTHVDRTTLVYITRDYDKKDEKDITSDCPVNRKPVFRQLRWHKVYRFLKEFEEDRLIVETLKFMEANNMARNYLFSAVDILALTHFPEVIKLMDETMDGEAKEKFEDVAGGIRQSASRLTQLKDSNRYFYSFNLKDRSLWCGYGYWLHPGDSTRYPDVGLALEVYPSSPERESIIAAMKNEVAEFPDKWEGYNLEYLKKWAGIQQRRSLKDFLAEENHTRAIEIYFVKVIGDLHEFKDNSPELPWTKP